MRFLVTGGAGFIGSNLVRSLLGLGEVSVVDNLSTGKFENISELVSGNRVTFLRHSVTNLEELKIAFSGIDCVFHQAALPRMIGSIREPLSCHKVNATGTLNVLLAARDSGVEKVVYASSSSVYGDDVVLPIKEDFRPEPRSPYAISKLMGEYYCKVFSDLYGLKTVSLRYFNVYGPNQDPSSQYSAVIPIFIIKLLNGERPVIFGNGEQTRDFVYVGDVVKANIQAMKKEVSGVYNVGRGKETSINELYQKISNSLGSDIPPLYSQAREGDILDSCGDISKAREFLEYEPVFDLETGIKETVEWYINFSKKYVTSIST
jgi:UDP-glucose 4-epimerase